MKRGALGGGGYTPSTGGQPRLGRASRKINFEPQSLTFIRVVLSNLDRMIQYATFKPTGDLASQETIKWRCATSGNALVDICEEKQGSQAAPASLPVQTLGSANSSAALDSAATSATCFELGETNTKRPREALLQEQKAI